MGGKPHTLTLSGARSIATNEAHSAVQASRVEEIIFGVLDGVITALALVVSVGGALTAAFPGVTPKLVFLTIAAAAVGGALSMDVGAALSARTRKELIARERAREEREVEEKPDEEVEEVRTIFRSQGYDDAQVEIMTKAVVSDKKRWVDLMMRDELGLSPDEDPQPLVHGTVIGLAYLFGGILPGIPFLFTSSLHDGLVAGLVVGGAQLIGVGALMAHFAGSSRIRYGGMVLAIGLATAFAVFLVTVGLNAIP